MPHLRRAQRGCIHQQNLLATLLLFGALLSLGFLPFTDVIADWAARPATKWEAFAFVFGALIAGLGVPVAVGIVIAKRRERRSRSGALRRTDASIRRRPTTRRLRLGPLRVGLAMCTCCWSAVPAGEMHDVCASCGGVQHPDCARWLGGCGRYACGERAVAGPPPVSASRATSSVRRCG